jgi:hypothetical protein
MMSLGMSIQMGIVSDRKDFGEGSATRSQATLGDLMTGFVVKSHQLIHGRPVGGHIFQQRNYG